MLSDMVSSTGQAGEDSEEDEEEQRCSGHC